jgi:hypothetical protein
MIKKHLVLLLLIIRIGGIFAQAPADSISLSVKYRNIVKINPFYIPFGVYGIAYERNIANKMSIQFYTDYIWVVFPKTDKNAYGNIESISFIPECRYYISENKQSMNQGYFAGIYLPFRYLSSTFKASAHDAISGFNGDKEQTSVFNYIGIGFFVGKKMIISKRISFEMLAGYSWGTDKGSMQTSIDVPIKNNNGQVIKTIEKNLPIDYNPFNNNVRISLNFEYHF